MFRKDVGSFVRLYDFMSQIIDYGDPALEKKQIYLRNLDRVIKPDNYTAPIDLSDVVLKQVKQIDRGKIDISLGVRVGLPASPPPGPVRSATRRWSPSSRCSTGSTTCSGPRTSPSRRRFHFSKRCCGPSRRRFARAASEGQLRQAVRRVP